MRHGSSASSGVRAAGRSGEGSEVLKGGKDRMEEGRGRKRLMYQ